jgi:hypothetical protein
MSYYVEVLAEKRDPVPLPYLRNALLEAGLSAVLYVDSGSDVDAGEPDLWTALLLEHPDEHPIAQITRYPVYPEESHDEPDNTGMSLIEDWLADLPEQHPQSAARWVAEYLPIVQVVYSFQILNGTDIDGGWDAVWAVQAALKEAVNGITHAESEGFTNRDGYHILWEFHNSPELKGPLEAAVLNERGEWVPFTMELSDPVHRSAFLAGKVPETAKRL